MLINSQKVNNDVYDDLDDVDVDVIAGRCQVAESSRSWAWVIWM